MIEIPLDLSALLVVAIGGIFAYILKQIFTNRDKSLENEKKTTELEYKTSVTQLETTTLIEKLTQKYDMEIANMKEKHARDIEDLNNRMDKYENDL